jgi:hypothetical protein
VGYHPVYRELSLTEGAATSGDLDLVTHGDFLMATDKGLVDRLRVRRNIYQR